MKADSFCEQFFDDMMNNVNTFDSNYNISYRNNIFYSYRMPICQHLKFGNHHYFEIVEKDDSPSMTTTKHISKLTHIIQNKIKDMDDVSITYVHDIVRREPNNEQ